MMKKMPIITSITTNIGSKLFQPLGGGIPFNVGKLLLLQQIEQGVVVVLHAHPVRLKADLFLRFLVFGLGLENLLGHGAGDLLRPNLHVIEIRVTDKLLLLRGALLQLDRSIWALLDQSDEIAVLQFDPIRLVDQIDQEDRSDRQRQEIPDDIAAYWRGLALRGAVRLAMLVTHWRGIPCSFSIVSLIVLRSEPDCRCGNAYRANYGGAR